MSYMVDSRQYVALRAVNAPFTCVMAE